jgi:hypothetical protein
MAIVLVLKYMACSYLIKEKVKESYIVVYKSEWLEAYEDLIMTS